MQIITVAIQKGGTGKTTTAAAIAHAAVYRGFKALAVDLDPQGNLSLLTAADTSGSGSYGLLQGEPAGDLIQHTPCGLDVIPANWNLSTITSGRGSARRLQKALQPLKRKYDLIVLDSPTQAGELQYNALQASTGLIIPLQAESFSIQSLYQMTDTAKQIQQSNPALKISGFIFTMFETRSNLSRRMQELIMQQAEAIGVPYLGAVRAAVAVREAAAFQQSLYEYAPQSKPAQDYLEIFDRLQIGGTV